MFESDQNDLQDEIAELSQPGPSGNTTEGELHDASFYSQEEHDPTTPQMTKKPFPLVLVGFGVLALIVVALLFMNRPKPDTTTPAGDLGQGINAASGLRGHLVTQWTGDKRTGKLQYQLRIEAMLASEAAGFALVAARPPAPYDVNIRLVDNNGFALCGKQILFHFDPTRSAPPPLPAPQPKGKKVDPAKIEADRQAQVQSLQAAEADRERGKDMFESLAGSDGMVNAVSAQGDLPCTADAYKRADYWDFTTSFPTIPEQEALRDPTATKAKLDRELQDKARPTHRKPTKPQSAFYIQGDDRIMGYDPARSLLQGEAGKSFLIDKKIDQSTAVRWASNHSIIHYRCDQHTSCALTAAGGLSAVHARLNE